MFLKFLKSVVKKQAGPPARGVYDLSYISNQSAKRNVTTMDTKVYPESGLENSLSTSNVASNVEEVTIPTIQDDTEQSTKQFSESSLQE